MKNKYLISGTLMVFVIALDLLTKHLAHASIDPGTPIELLPFLQLVNVRNTGAAFGMFDSLGNGFFIAVSFIAIALVIWMFLRGDMHYIGLTLVVAGAIGSLYDRLPLGYVRDFLDVHIGPLHWPAFNVADSALTVGLVLMLVMLFFEQPTQKERTPSHSSD